MRFFFFFSFFGIATGLGLLLWLFLRVGGADTIGGMAREGYVEL